MVNGKNSRIEGPAKTAVRFKSSCICRAAFGVSGSENLSDRNVLSANCGAETNSVVRAQAFMQDNILELQDESVQKRMACVHGRNVVATKIWDGATIRMALSREILESIMGKRNYHGEAICRLPHREGSYLGERTTQEAAKFRSTHLPIGNAF